MNEWNDRYRRLCARVRLADVRLTPMFTVKPGNDDLEFYTAINHQQSYDESCKNRRETTL